jgi:hypothetical protein
MHEAWREFRIDIEQMDEEGDCFVLALRFRGTGVGSGVESDLTFANAIRIREELQVEIISRRTVEEAREALQGGQARHEASDRLIRAREEQRRFGGY